MLTRLMFIMSILLTTGCATLFPDRRMVEPQRVKNFQVEFEHEVSLFEEGFALLSIDHIIRAWEGDHEVLPQGWTIRISSHSVVEGRESSDLPIPPWSDDPWFTLRIKSEALGTCIHSKKLIYVTLGEWSDVPSLYHEFCHAVLAPGDPDHLASGWPDWKKRAKELAWDLRSIWWERRNS